MSRTIKFRGQREDNKEWVYGYYAKKWIQTLKNDGRFEYYIVNQIVDEEGQMWNESFKVIPETLGQFIGLFDKNGREIYEGDIVEWCDYKMLIEFGEIICEGIGFKWSPINHDRVESITGFIDEYEIIGNIHDNKELL